MSFPARYPGRCGTCDERIHEGDPIRMVDNGDGDRFAAHDDCDTVPTTDPLATTNPVCQTCWLTHPEGACDR